MPVSAEEAGNDKPEDNSKPGLAIHLHGALASLLRLACGLPMREVVGAAAQMQKTSVLFATEVCVFWLRGQDLNL